MNNLEQIANWFIITYLAIIGLCIGSFLNVVILRGLSGEDLCFARSKCPNCGNLIKWFIGREDYFFHIGMQVSSRQVHVLVILSPHHPSALCKFIK